MPDALALRFALALTILATCASGLGLVSASGGAFVENGAPLRVAGTNALSLAQFSDAFGVQDLLTRMAGANLTLLRLWAFSDGELCQPTPRQNFFQCWDAATRRVVVNETALALHLDRTLAAASRAGVHVLLSLTNNWPAYGGIPAYVQWREAAAAAGVAPPPAAPVHHDDFFVDEVMRGWYRDWAATLAGRINTITGVAYRDDPTIFAWELANEVACTNSSAAAPCVVNGTSPAMLAWVAEMSAHIKSIDSSHMVSIGDEGFLGASSAAAAPCPGRQWWCNGSAEDWLGLLQLPGIDFASLHMYPDSFEMGQWGMGLEDEVAAAWLANHTRQAHALGKPLLLGEFGHGAAQLQQHAKYAGYLRTAHEVGMDGWAVWMLAALDDSVGGAGGGWPFWWRGGDAQLQVYCLKGGDPAPPADGGMHDLSTCAVIAAAASGMQGGGALKKDNSL